MTVIQCTYKADSTLATEPIAQQTSLRSQRHKSLPTLIHPTQFSFSFTLKAVGI